MQTQALTISDVIDSGVSLSWQEAVALVQAIVAAVGAGRPASGPSAGTLEDFSICESGEVTLAPERLPALSVSELALFLGQLLPTESAEPETRTPAGVRFAIARALGLVEAPPIVSVPQLSKTLARFEQEDRGLLIAALFRRCRPSPEHASSAAGERRRTQPDAATLRELLREADERTYLALHVHDRARPDDRASAPTPDMFRRFLREADIRNFELAQALKRRPAPPPPGKASRRHPVHAGLGVVAIVASGAIVGIPALRETTTGALVPIVKRAVPRSMSAVPKSMTRVYGRSSERGPVMPRGTALKPVPQIPAPKAHEAAPPPANRTVAAAAPSRDESASTVPAASTSLANATENDGAMVESLDVKNRPVFSPSFSADGSAVFFDTREGGGSAVMEARTDRIADRGRGNDLRVVSIVNDGARNYHPRLSPNGNTLAFDSDREGERGVYLADRDGRHVRRVSGSGYAAVPTWSPDGRQLAFIKAEPERAKVWNVWLLDVSTGGMRRLTAYRYGQPWGASWFPDGRRICFAHEDRLVVLDLASGASRAYASPVRGRLVRTPAVSPDGEHVIFQLYHDGAWLMDLRDGTMRRVLDDPSAEEFAWTPDGRQVAFHSRRSGDWGVWFMAPQR